MYVWGKSYLSQGKFTLCFSWLQVVPKAPPINMDKMHKTDLRREIDNLNGLLSKSNMQKLQHICHFCCEELTWCEPSASMHPHNVLFWQPDILKLYGSQIASIKPRTGSWYRNRYTLAGDRNEVIEYRSFLRLSLLRCAKGSSTQSRFY